MSLDKYIKINTYIPEPLAQNYFSQIVNALKILYQKDIFHRDIKPNNILIENNVIYLCDFGLSKYISQDNYDIKQSIVGSPLFMSPEIYGNLQFNIKSDLWSLGLVLFEMLAGYNYLNSKNIPELLNKIKNTDIPHIDNISNNVSDLLIKLLNKNVDKRIEWEDLFIHDWIITNIKINTLIEYIPPIVPEESYDDFLILSTDNEIDKYSMNNSFTFNDIFENSIEAIKNFIL